MKLVAAILSLLCIALGVSCSVDMTPPPPEEGEEIGVSRDEAQASPCGNAVCSSREYCCNRSCSICAPLGGACTQEVCTSYPRSPRSCVTSEDCRTFSSYCGSCACQALGVRDPEPVCRRRLVNCLADPCQGHEAICVRGQCRLTP